MSDWHFGIDYDMWLYPPVKWWEPDYDCSLPEPIEAANIEGTLLVNAEDAIEQVRRLQAENENMRKYIERKEHLANVVRLIDENSKLRELVRGMHMAYIGALNECEGMDAGLIWDHCEMVDAELAKSHARFEADRHRFDAAMRELGVELP